MISLLALLVRLIFLAVFTFGFVVLFEHGPAGFVQGAPQEWHSLVEFAQKTAGGAPTVAPAPTPANS